LSRPNAPRTIVSLDDVPFLVAETSFKIKACAQHGPFSLRLHHFSAPGTTNDEPHRGASDF
jgi:hypothetical protein